MFWQSEAAPYRVGHATKDLLRRRAGQIFYCTLCVHDLNAVHIGGKAACSALLPMFWQSEAAPYRVGHATKDLLRRRAGQIFYCTHRVQDLNAVHIGGKAAVVSGALAPAERSIRRRTMRIDKLREYDV
jgi:hypothetical protein